MKNAKSRRYKVARVGGWWKWQILCDVWWNRDEKLFEDEINEIFALDPKFCESGLQCSSWK